MVGGLPRETPKVSARQCKCARDLTGLSDLEPGAQSSPWVAARAAGGRTLSSPSSGRGVKEACVWLAVTVTEGTLGPHACTEVWRAQGGSRRTKGAGPGTPRQVGDAPARGARPAGRTQAERGVERLSLVACASVL